MANRPGRKDDRDENKGDDDQCRWRPTVEQSDMEPEDTNRNGRTGDCVHDEPLQCRDLGNGKPKTYDRT